MPVYVAFGHAAPDAQAPSATTLAASQVGQTVALLNGVVNPNGLDTSTWFEWGTSPTLATFNSTAPVQLTAGTSNVSAQRQVTTLTANTTYYFRVAAQNALGTTRGSILSFQTAQAPVQVAPTVQTLAAASIGLTSATLHGSANPNGVLSQGWFEYGTSPTLATFTVTSQRSIGGGTSEFAFNEPITGLTEGTQYYFRAAASNANGTTKGSIQTFQTQTQVVVPGQSPLFEWARYAYIDYGIHRRPLVERNSLYDLGAARYDLVINGGMVPWKSRNPTLRYFEYDLLWQHRLDTIIDIDTWLPAHGFSVEDAFIHAPAGVTIPAYWTGGKPNGPNTTHFPSVVSDGTKTFANRWKSNQYGDDWYDFFNPRDAGFRAWRAEKTQGIIAPTSQGLAIDGMMYDVSSYTAMNSVTKGVRFPGQAGEPQSFSEYLADVLVVTAADAAITGANVGNYAEAYNQATNQTLLRAMKGALLEYVNNPYGTIIQKWPVIDQMILDDVLVVLTSNVSTTAKDKSRNGCSAGNFASIKDRHLIWELVSYMMLVNTAKMDNLYVCFQVVNFDYVGITLTWIPAFEVDVGLPVGDKHIYQTGTDPAGQPARVRARELENAWIFMRSPDGSNQTNASDVTAVTVNMPNGTPLRLLNGDGTLGPPVTSVQLTMSEGVVMMKG